MSIQTLIVLTMSLIAECYTARILAVFPSPSFSHQVMFRPLTQELAKRGHNVTVITTDPVFTAENKQENLIEIDVRDISYKTWNEKFIQKSEFGKRERSYDILTAVVNIVMMPLTEAQIKTNEIQHLINNAEFDLLLIEAWPRHGLVYSHIFKAPVIQISSFGSMVDNDDTVGLTVHPFLYPMTFQQRHYNMSYWDKVEQLYKYVLFKNMWSSGEDEEIKLFRQFLGHDLPDYNELRNNVDMLFLNIHPIWLNNRPLPRNVISIWGIYDQPENELPQDLKTYLDSSKNGVIYVSFGSNVRSSTLPSEFIQLLIRVFSKLPYDVLWKWEKDELPGKSQNIRISKWLPQSDLIKHPNIKLFITQGGLQSAEDAFKAGVPFICVPMLGDQWNNVEKYVHFKIGIGLDMETINDKNLTSAIQTVIGDRRYRENVIKLRTILKDQSETALDRAVWWTEYVLRHGGAKHLRSPAANMPLVEYYEIYFFLELLTMLAFILAILIKAIFFLIQKAIPKTKLKSS